MVELTQHVIPGTNELCVPRALITTISDLTTAWNVEDDTTFTSSYVL